MNSTEPGNGPSRQRRRLRMPSLGVVAYIIAIVAPLLMLPAAYIKANVVYLGDGFRHAVQGLFIAPLLGLAIGILALIRRTPAGGRSFAKAAIVIGLFGMGIVSFHASAINGFESWQHKAKCLNNLKHIADALRLYSSDYDGTLPSSYLYGRSKTWNPTDFSAFASRRGELPARTAGRVSWPGLLYSYGMDRTTMWCPSDPNALSDSPDATVSYYWKAAIDRAWYGGFRRLDSFEAPSDQILVYERLGWHYDGDLGLADDSQMNCVYLDGHVETVVISQSGYTKSENPPGPLPKSGVGEPAWFNCPRDLLGQNSPRMSKGMNWNPKAWADEMR